MSYHQMRVEGGTRTHAIFHIHKKDYSGRTACGLAAFPDNGDKIVARKFESAKDPCQRCAKSAK